MAQFILLSLASPEQVAEQAANLWLMKAFQNDAGSNLHTVALSGGRIAKTFFEAVARSPMAKEAAWDKVHFFWADERCVPPESPESNYRVARESLLSPLGIAKECIHRIRGEEEPRHAAQLACHDLNCTTRQTANGLPVLDIIFLGMGEDGHVASLFPEGPAPEESTELYFPVIASKSPPQRITMSYGLIGAAREVIVLASGGGKKDALRQSIRSGGKTPLARVLHLRSQTIILTDIDLS